MSITLKQLRPLACHTRAHCRTCRTDADWREAVTGVREFDCPHGITRLTMPVRGLGDVIENITSTARIKPCRRCKKTRDSLNKILPFKGPKDG